MERHTSADQSCGRFAELIHDRADGALDAGAQAGLGGHIASCAACRALAADLETMRRTASELPDFTPRAEVWAGISQRLAGELAARRALLDGRARGARHGRTLLVAVASGVWVLRSPAASPPQASPASPAAGVINRRETSSKTLTNTSASRRHYGKRLPAWSRW
jgi:anti-sigma factor RsiW